MCNRLGLHCEGGAFEVCGGEQCVRLKGIKGEDAGGLG